ncbi:MAG: plastocyanin/azurin family copper-binding protein [Actinomycetes bacterium]
MSHTHQSSHNEGHMDWTVVISGVGAFLAALAIVVALFAYSKASSASTIDSASNSVASPPAASAPAAAVPAAAASAPTAGTAINANLGEMFIKLSGATAPAGQVSFTTKNSGAIPHEMVIVKTDKAANALGAGARVSEVGSIGETGDVEVGKTKTVKFNMKPGHYALICNLPGHYAGGMRADFTVN